MSYTLKLDAFEHDIRIRNGKFIYVTGADEVRQRIKVALWHNWNEYFLNRPSGVPWYDGILGSKMQASTLENILRKKILDVPGVLRIINLDVSRKVRDYFLNVSVVVQRGKNDTTGSVIDLNAMRIGG